jgi:hypothetical protein
MAPRWDLCRKADPQDFTDPDSRIMKSKRSFEQQCNAQVAVDSEHQIIAATAVTGCVADHGRLMPTVRSAEADTGLDAQRVPAVARYPFDSNQQALEGQGIGGYAALGHQGGEPVPCDDQSTTARLDRKLRTERPRSRFKNRKHIGERVFDQATRVLRFTSSRVRCCRKVAGEKCPICLALELRRRNGCQTARETA